MTKIAIKDSSVIEVMNAGIEERQAELHRLRKERDALRVKNVEAILSAAGIVFGVTKVRVWENAYGRITVKPGPYFVMFVRPQGQIEFAKVKMDGTPSAASSGLGSSITEIEVIK